MVPPCINKFYILDLQPENSLVRYAVEQGNTVFLVSWRNPDQSLAGTTWDDYVEHGAIKAIEVARDISGADKVNAFGFCVGGTIASTALAVLAARGQQPAASLTLLTTLLDFRDTGVLEVFVDETQVALREQPLAKRRPDAGPRPGDHVLGAASERPGVELRAVELPEGQGAAAVRPAVLEFRQHQPAGADVLLVPAQYLSGKQPEGAGQADGGRRAGRPGRASMRRSSSTARRKTISCRGPRRLRRCACSIRSKPKANRFVLGASGHIAGVINPASKNKRSYWANDAQGDKAKAAAAEAWFAGATEHKGSWWPEWARFLAEHGGKDVTAPAKPGNASYQPIEPAPGRYVKVRAD